MFFITYLRRELRRRMRQAVFIALGLALGVGLVVTVEAASAGVKKAQSDVLSALYKVGTDVTVTGAAQTPAPGPQSHSGPTLQKGPDGPQICTDGKCVNAAGQTFDQQLPLLTAPISASKVAAVARLHDVTAASGVLGLTEGAITFPADFGGPGVGSAPQVSTLSLDGVATGPATVGPLSSATITSGRSFTAADSDADVAVLDSGYAKSGRLKDGSVITVGQIRFTVIGIVSQPQGSSPADVYLPLARAIAAASGPGENLTNDVTLIDVTAASSADIPAVQREISRLLPGDTVTTASGLARQVTQSVSNAATLVTDLGEWLSALVLFAAFAMASLLTMASVARRSAEFGTLKALGWRTRRITAQVLGESVAMGIAGAAAGVGLGYAGAAIIGRIAPKLKLPAPAAGGPAGTAAVSASGPGGHSTVTSAPHPFVVPLSPSITIGVIALAVVLAVAGGLLAGLFGSWRIARLRPADALTRVA